MTDYRGRSDLTSTTMQPSPTRPPRSHGQSGRSLWALGGGAPVCVGWAALLDDAVGLGTALGASDTAGGLTLSTGLCTTSELSRRAPPGSTASPLASIRVFGELLRLGRVDNQEKVKEYGDYIETESRRLTQLINNILDFASIESGRKTYHFERCDVREVVCQTLKTFEVRLRQKGFNIIVKGADVPLPPARIDAGAIAQ